MLVLVPEALLIAEERSEAVLGILGTADRARTSIGHPSFAWASGVRQFGSRRQSVPCEPTAQRPGLLCRATRLSFRNVANFSGRDNARRLCGR